MSKYCGKCDLWDSLVMIREVNDETTDWDKIKIYQINDDSCFDEDGWHNVELLDIKCLKDLLPYAAYIVGMAFGNGDKYTAYIGTESYVQEMERERIEWAIRDVKRVYDKCKREGKEFDISMLKDDIWSSTSLHTEIAKRMAEHPTSFKIDDLKILICEYYKASLYDDMIKEGYSENEAYEWCYNNKKAW